MVQGGGSRLRFFPRRERLYWIAFLNGSPEFFDTCQTTLDCAAAGAMKMMETEASTKRIDPYLLPRDFLTVTDRTPRPDDTQKNCKWKD